MDFARQVKSQVNLVDVVGERVKLKRIGATPRYTGLCPFHTEKTPSFHVNAEHQYYYCFGCQAKGDVFGFLMQMDGLTFWEAAKALAERYGIPLPQRSEQADRESRQREALYRMNEIALKLFRRNLTTPQGEEARKYLTGRGVNGEVAERFGIGLSDRNNSVLQALQREGFTAEQLEHSGLVLKRQEGGGFFDAFRGRLMFTIHNELGKVCGFAGRALAPGDEPKYRNSPKTAVYDKSNLLYNLHRAREAAKKTGRFILVEGYMDVIGLDMAGIGEGVASCGTALTPEQVRMMKRFAPQVVVNFDPDTGGVKGTERSISILLDEHLKVRVLELAEDLDPDEFIAKYGPEHYAKIATGAPTYYFWLADQARKRFDVTGTEGRREALAFLLPALHRISDKIERAATAGDLAAYLGVDRGLILEQFKKAALDRRESAPKAPAAPALREVERLLLREILRYPDLRQDVIPSLQAMHTLEAASLFQACAQAWHADAGFSYGDLEARCEERDRALLSSLIFADETDGEQNMEAARANVLACLRTLEAEEKERQVQHIRRQIRAAEQNRDMPEALRLMEELDRVRRAHG
ncbi:MAG: DNA primase [Bryobacterales bacterium]|nr:DNA primase [Bryobacterales bacterium]